MFIRLVFCVLCFCVLSTSVSANQGQGQGEMEVNIIQPSTMDLETLKEFCHEEPDTIACELYLEKVEDEELKIEESYNVYTANFQ